MFTFSKQSLFQRYQNQSYALYHFVEIFENLAAVNVQNSNYARRNTQLLTKILTSSII